MNRIKAVGLRRLLPLVMIPAFVCGLGVFVEGVATAESVSATVSANVSHVVDALRANEYGDALATYLRTLDLARSSSPRQMETVDSCGAVLLLVLLSAPDSEIDAVEATLPDWDTLTNPEPKAAEAYFFYKRMGRCEDKGDAVRMRRYATLARDLSWELIEQHPNALAVRSMVGVYLRASQRLGAVESERAQRALKDYMDTHSPSVATYCAAYQFAEAADRAGDTEALVGYCRHMMEAYDRGALTDALNDPYGSKDDKLQIQYFVAYAAFILNRPDDVLAQCDLIDETFAPDKSATNGPEAVVLAALLRAIVRAQFSAANPDGAAAAYDEFLARYADSPNCARALVNKGLHYERAWRFGEAYACFAKALRDFPRAEASAQAETLRQKYVACAHLIE